MEMTNVPRQMHRNGLIASFRVRGVNKTSKISLAHLRKSKISSNQISVAQCVFGLEANFEQFKQTVAAARESIVGARVYRRLC